MKLYILTGYPGVGKTVVAHKIAELDGGYVIDSDRVRKSIFPQPEYTDWETEVVYGEMFGRADNLIEQDNVVLDATFSEKRHRDMAREIHDNYELVKVESDALSVRERLVERTGYSDADMDVYRLVKENYDELGELEDHTTIDNSGSWSNTLSQIRNIVYEDLKNDL